LAYLLVFGLGTVAGMMVITAAIAVPFTLSENRLARMNRFLATASGVVSLVFGLLIVTKWALSMGCSPAIHLDPALIRLAFFRVR